MAQKPRTQIAQYESFLLDVLRPDLRRALDLKEKLLQELHEFDDLEANLKDLAEQEGPKELSTLVDLGGKVFCQARVHDASHVYLSVGLGFHVECTLDDAPRVIELRRQALQSKIQEASAQCAKIQAHIKLVEGGLRELKQLGQEARA